MCIKLYNYTLTRWKLISCYMSALNKWKKTNKKIESLFQNIKDNHPIMSGKLKPYNSKLSKQPLEGY